MMNNRGTWAGATENLRNHWTNLFVKDDPESPGLKALQQLGAQPIHVPTDTHVGKEWLRRALQPATQFTEEQPRVTLAEPNQQFYKLFLNQILRILEDKKKIKLKEVKEHFPYLCQKHIKDWLDRAVEDEYLVRYGKTRSYSLSEQKSKQLKLKYNKQQRGANL